MLVELGAVVLVSAVVALVLDRAIRRLKLASLSGDALVVLLPAGILGASLLGMVVGLLVTEEVWSVAVAGAVLTAPIILRWTALVRERSRGGSSDQVHPADGGDPSAT